MLALSFPLVNNRAMSFADEFEVLDPELVQRAYANVSGDLLIIAEFGDELSQKLPEYIERIGTASPAYLSLIERHQDTTSWICETSDMENRNEAFYMTAISLGEIAVGLVLTEAARLESEGRLGD